VIFLEDIHWADDLSLDFFDQLIGGMEAAPLFVIGNARTSFLERRPKWGEGQAFHKRISLGPLTRQASRELVAEILKKAIQVPLLLRELVVGGAEGNPFYIEELIKMLIENGTILKGEGHWEVKQDRLLELDVPPTLTAVLQARLESLPAPERKVLQQAAVVGRIFWQDALEKINASIEPKKAIGPIDERLQVLEQRR
jgi:predicted ATPase